MRPISGLPHRSSTTPLHQELKPPQEVADPVADYATAVNRLDIQTMSLLRRHHISLTTDFEQIDAATIAYRRNLEIEVELLTAFIETMKNKLRDIGDDL